MRSLPPIESLECFVAASNAKTFREAARGVHLSPAAFGQRVRQLEGFVGTRLFERTKRRVELTAAGRSLLPKVSEVLASVSELPSLAASPHAVVPRSVTVGTRHELGLSWLTPMLCDLECAVPGLRLDLHFGSGAELLQLLEDRRIDAAVSSSRLPTRRFAFESLCEERYCLVASRKSGIWRLRGPGDLSPLTLVDTRADLPLARYWYDADPARAHIQFRDVRALGTIAAVRDFVVRNGGVAVLPEYFVKKDLRMGRLKRLFPRQKMLSDFFRLVFLPKHRDIDVLRRLAQRMRATPLR